MRISKLIEIKFQKRLNRWDMMSYTVFPQMTQVQILKDLKFGTKVEQLVLYPEVPAGRVGDKMARSVALSKLMSLN